MTSQRNTPRPARGRHARPATWRDDFTRAHGFDPPFTAAEMTEPWCATCCDFHRDTGSRRDHSAILACRQTDACMCAVCMS